MINTWSPLFSSIVASSIWSNELHIRVVWITMIAMKDRNGFVDGSIPGLARMSAVSLEQCQEALKILESPDEFSKNTEDEGRRIKSVEGGWVILGHERYQKLMQEISTKVNAAKRQAAWRDRNSKAQKEYRKDVRATGKKLKHAAKLKPEELGVNGNPTAAEVEQMEQEQRAALMRE